MAITINNNTMASNANRNLSATYGKLATSIQRMSSGLRINSAADDAAGLAIREMMRADIATTQQGIRNAADAVSMIQTADGALGVIDEKLTRMKELAEQAATGTYTTVQRDIINSEYQAMAREIDRIANATNFNGIKLLDGSVSNQYGGQGVKVHFGVSNNAAEDYYFINIGDARATSSTGLRVGGDAKNDVWAQGGAGASYGQAAGCCSGGFESLNGNAGFTSGQTFSFGYNWDWMEDNDENLLSGKYLAGRYTVGSSESLQDLVSKVNAGTQSRVGIQMGNITNYISGSSGTLGICIGDEAYYWGSASVAEGTTQYVQNWTYSMSAQNSAGQSLYQVNGVGNDKVYVASGAVKTIIETAGGTTNAMMVEGVVKDVVVGQSATSADAARAINKEVNEVRKSIDGTVTAGSAMTSAITSATGQYSINGTTVTGYNSAAVKAMLASSAISSATGAGSATVTMTGIYGSSAAGATGWTRDADLAAALGWGEISFDVRTEGQTATQISTALTAGFAAFGNELVVEPPDSGTFMDNVTVTDVANLDLSIESPARARDVPGIIGSDKTSITQVDDNAGNMMGGYNAESLARAINENEDSSYWAMTGASGSNMVYVFSKEGGDNNNIQVCEVGGGNAPSQAALNAVSFEHVASGTMHNSGTTLSLGGEKWGTMTPTLSRSNNGNETWNVTLNGRDVGEGRDLWIANLGDLTTPGLTESIINGLDRDSFAEVQNAANAVWKGAEIRTQSSAQESLDALTEAIVKKDKIRADLGAMQNRLENTMTNLEIQAENLQAAESRISDVDVAKEMTEFTKNNVMTQAATSMLAQANSLSHLALSLIG